MFDIFKKKVYRCKICGRIETPILFNENIVKDFGWVKDHGWICKWCSENLPQAEKEIEYRKESNKHHNLAMKYRFMNSEYGNKKYKKMFEEYGV